MKERTDKGNIMLVDDTPANLMLLEEMLGMHGYRVRSFPRGRLALAAALNEPPDLVLLDIDMPEMDGYEVCQRFKSVRELDRIPIIFLSALYETIDKVKAFGCGGVDYVTKPFQLAEVLARVDTHINLRRFQQELERQNEKLDDLVALRTRQLQEAQTRLARLDKAKDDFLRLISHELRTPLNGLFGIGELVFEACQGNPTADQLRGMFKESEARLLSMIEDALLLTQIDLRPESVLRSRSALGPALRQAVEAVSESSERRGARLGAVPSSLEAVLAERALLQRALELLLRTALKFAHPGETVGLSLEVAEAEVRLLIEGKGACVPEAVLPRFFEVLAISETMVPGGGIGLAPALAERILAAFGGTVAVENLAWPGIRLTVRLLRADDGDAVRR